MKSTCAFQLGSDSCLPGLSVLRLFRRMSVALHRWWKEYLQADRVVTRQKQNLTDALRVKNRQKLEETARWIYRLYLLRVDWCVQIRQY
jgi:hypothetical protein